MRINRESSKELFDPLQKIEIAYVFGSEVTGNTHPESDIDIALVVREELTAEEEARLATSISKMTEAKRVDIVILNSAPSLLKYEAIANGVLIHQNVPDERVNQFEMSVYREYFDTEHIRKLQYQLLIEEA